jgi:ApbE superfamily uncharacterized protein (UPF0280 family)
MAYDTSIHLLSGGAVMVECGPMRLVIHAGVGRVAQPHAAVRAARESVVFLERLARARPLLGRGFHDTLARVSEPLALTMIASVEAVGDHDLTPMAAVAGTIADAVADFLVERGQTRVIVENGGDVAVRTVDGEAVTVGIRTEVGNARPAHVVALDPGRSAWGVATSGVGGRSLTRGVVSAATVVAATASLADAAATAVANASRVADDAVARRAAEDLDPHTDIPGLSVTVSVGPLAEETRRRALAQSIRRAEDLVQRGVIFGAFAALQGDSAMTAFMAERLAGA